MGLLCSIHSSIISYIVYGILVKRYTGLWYIRVFSTIFTWTQKQHSECSSCYGFGNGRVEKKSSFQDLVANLQTSGHMDPWQTKQFFFSWAQIHFSSSWLIPTEFLSLFPLTLILFISSNPMTPPLPSALAATPPFLVLHNVMQLQAKAAASWYYTPPKSFTL